MNCPRCGAPMDYDTEIRFDDGKIIIYVCPECHETASENIDSQEQNRNGSGPKKLDNLVINEAVHK